MDIIEEYMEEVEKDTKVNQFSVKDVQMHLPGIKHKWVGRLIRHKRRLNALINEKKTTKARIVEEIQERSLTKISVPVAERSAESSDILKEISNKMVEEEIVIEYLEKVERIFSSMSYDISNIIKIIQLETL